MVDYLPLKVLAYHFLVLRKEKRIANNWKSQSLAKRGTRCLGHRSDPANRPTDRHIRTGRHTRLPSHGFVFQVRTGRNARLPSYDFIFRVTILASESARRALVSQVFLDEIKLPRFQIVRIHRHGFGRHVGRPATHSDGLSEARRGLFYGQQRQDGPQSRFFHH